MMVKLISDHYAPGDFCLYGVSIMKMIFIMLIMILSFTSICLAYESSIKSLLGIPFGEICTIKAEFVDKPDTYYAQNISHSGFYLKIYEVNNVKLLQCLVVEPVYDKNVNIEKNKIHTFKAYETIQSQNEPIGWINSDIAEQLNYWIVQKIVIKEP
jgi:hypothetical protein